ncbi:MAG: hypothetical protein LR005_00275 [Candidatus Pacebacteria bacterium]|nr:hypothetical protein [Candidatus Paceibacterota bacterium]
MDNQDFQKQLDEQQQALTMIYKSVEKTRKMIMWSGIITAATFIIPLIIVVVMLPKMIGTLTGSLNALDGVDTQSVNVESLTDTLNNLKDLGF